MDPGNKIMNEYKIKEIFIKTKYVTQENKLNFCKEIMENWILCNDVVYSLPVLRPNF